MRAAFAVASILAVCATSLGAQTRTSTYETIAEPPPIDSVSQAHDLGFKDDPNERMTVPVRVSGTGPYRFLVDTGADRTVVSRQLAGRLRLGAGRTSRLHTLTGSSAVETALIPSLQLSKKHIRIDDAPLLEHGHMGADGILGVDSLRSQRLLFDFKARTMTIVPAATRVDPDEEGTIVVRARERNGRLMVTNAQADGQRLSVVIDTGSQVTIGNRALQRRLAGRRKLRSSGPIELESVTGEIITGEYMVLDKLEIGGVTLENLAIVFADAHTFRHLKLDHRPALLLGMNAMRAFDKVSIDFANRKLRMMLPEHGSIDGALLAAR